MKRREFIARLVSRWHLVLTSDTQVTGERQQR